MASISGIQVAEASLAVFNDVKTKKRDFAIFKMNDSKTEVVPDMVFPETEEDLKAFKEDNDNKTREQNFETRVYPKFKEALTSVTNQSRYAVLDFRWVGPEGPRDKLLFIYWCPDKCNVKEKMTSASTAAVVSGKFGLTAKLECHEASDLDLANLVAKAQSK